MGSIFENTRAYDQGRDARHYRSKRADNPFNKVRDYYRWQQWDMGWSQEDAWVKRVMEVKITEIHRYQQLGFSYHDAFKKAAGDLRDEDYTAAQQTKAAAIAAQAKQEEMKCKLR